MVDLDPMADAEDITTVKALLTRHARYTQSAVAQKILARWEDYQTRFVKVMPRDYKRVLLAIKKARAAGASVDAAVMEAAHG